MPRSTPCPAVASRIAATSWPPLASNAVAPSDRAASSGVAGPADRWRRRASRPPIGPPGSREADRPQPRRPRWCPLDAPRSRVEADAQRLEQRAVGVGERLGQPDEAALGQATYCRSAPSCGSGREAHRRADVRVPSSQKTQRPQAIAGSIATRSPRRAPLSITRRTRGPAPVVHRSARRCRLVPPVDVEPHSPRPSRARAPRSHGNRHRLVVKTDITCTVQPRHLLSASRRSSRRPHRSTRGNAPADLDPGNRFEWLRESMSH